MILIYDAHVHLLSNLDPINCGPGTILRDKSLWVINALKVMEQFPAIITPGQDSAHATKGMDTIERHAEATHGHGTYAKTRVDCA